MTHNTTPAPLGKRLLAYIIDSVLLNVVFDVCMRVIYKGEFHEWLQKAINNIMQELPPPEFHSSVVIWSLLIPLLYSVGFWVYLGALPAQFMLKMRVIQDKSSQKLNPVQAIIRHVALSLLLMMCILLPFFAPFIIGFVLIHASKSHHNKAIHDLLAKSRVIDITLKSKEPSHNSTERSF